MRIKLLSLILILTSCVLGQTTVKIKQIKTIPGPALWYSDETGNLIPLKLGSGFTIVKGIDGSLTLQTTTTLAYVIYTLFMTEGQQIITIPLPVLEPMSKVEMFLNGIFQTPVGNPKPDYVLDTTNRTITYHRPLGLGDTVQVVVWTR